MANQSMERRLTAILAADVVGYARLMGADQEGTRAQFNAHYRELIEPSVTQHRGRIVKTTGDALLVEFASVVDAVECAVAIQKDMAERTDQSGTASTKWKSQDHSRMPSHLSRSASIDSFGPRP